MASEDHSGLLSSGGLGPEADRALAIADESRRQFATSLAIIEAALAGREHIWGHAFTAADVLVGSTLM